MGIEARDLFLISPELSLVALAAIVVLLDLVARRAGAAVVVGLVGLIAPFAAGIGLWNEVHAAGGAELGFNGSLVVDKFALYFKFLILGVLALVFLAGADHLKRFRPYEAEFVALVLFSSAGLMLLPASADLITLYVSLELASLPVVALAAFAKSQARSVEAGMKYLVLSAIASAVLLYGFAFIYAATGSIRLMPLDGGPTIAGIALAGDDGSPFGSLALMAGAVMAAAGFGFKLSMAPFQMWTPDVYEGAPTPVAAFLAVASKAAAFAVVLRVFYAAFPGDLSADWSIMYAVLAVVTMSVGNAVAIAQSNIKRLLGYSAIAQAGYVLIGVAAVAGRSPDAADEVLGVSSVLFYLGGYAAMNLAAFFAVIVITDRTANDRIDGLAGMGYRSPALAAVLAFALLSLTGLPPTVGFMGKLFLFNAAVNADLTWLAVVGVVNSVVSAYYYIGVVRVMYLRSAEDDSVVSAGIPARVAIGVAAAGVLVLGLWPGGLLSVARTAADSLLA